MTHAEIVRMWSRSFVFNWMIAAIFMYLYRTAYVIPGVQTKKHYLTDVFQGLFWTYFAVTFFVTGVAGMWFTYTFEAAEIMFQNLKEMAESAETMGQVAGADVSTKNSATLDNLNRVQTEI